MILVASTVAAHACDGRTEFNWLTHRAVWKHGIYGYFLAAQLGQGHDAKVRPLIDAVRDLGGTVWTYSLDQGESHVTSDNRLPAIAAGRNLVHEYVTFHPDISHVQWIDTDIVPTVDGIEKLREVDHPIVGAHVPAYCVDDETEALTRRGWKHRWELEADDELLSLDPMSRAITWQEVQRLNVFDWDGPLVRWKGRRIDALTTPDHRWLIRDRHNDPDSPCRFATTEELGQGRHDRIALGGGTPMCFADTPVYSDEFVELLGWAVTEGTFPKRGHSVIIKQSITANREYVERLRSLGKHFRDQGATATEWGPWANGCIDFHFGKGIGRLIRQAVPNRQLGPDLLCSLTIDQARLLHSTMIDADGCRAVQGESFGQRDQGRIDAFQMLSAMLGLRTHSRPVVGTPLSSVVWVLRYNNIGAENLRPVGEHYVGKVWCPTVATGSFFVRRGGFTYWTGNCHDGPKVDREWCPPGEAHTCERFPVGADVREHWTTAGGLLMTREVIKALRWRSDKEDGLSEDPAFQIDAVKAGFGQTWVRHDVVWQHQPLVILEYRGRDLSVVR